MSASDVRLSPYAPDSRQSSGREIRVACLTAAALCWIDLPLQAVILLAPPMVLVQAWILDTSYAARGRLRAPIPGLSTGGG